MRQLCAMQLAKFGVTYSEFSPTDPHWDRQLQPATRMVYVESPGSLLYDMLDLPALSQVCKQRDILLCADNTWGSGINYQPLNLGCDISVVAATKYLSGHSDVMMGSVTASKACFAQIEQASNNLGQTVSAEDAFLVLRGLRTLELRLQRHASSALHIAQWLSAHHVVRSVFHPALQGDANHELWQRDATGSNGLLTIEFNPDLASEKIEQAIDGLQLFGIGSSWEAMKAWSFLSTRCAPGCAIANMATSCACTSAWKTLQTSCEILTPCSTAWHKLARGPSQFQILINPFRARHEN